jgi:hypothetical protein
MSAPILPPPTINLAKAMPGVWWLQSRQDWTKDGQQRIDPILGANPIAILTYTPTHFAAQFMNRNRTEDTANQTSHSSKNNTGGIGGYDAYFGTYQVNEQTGEVAHTLIGSLTLSNIGKTFMRSIRISGDELTLQLETATTENEPITRTLVWKRMS